MFDCRTNRTPIERLGSIGFWFAFVRLTTPGMFLVVKNRRLWGWNCCFSFELFFIITQWSVTLGCTWHSSGAFFTLQSQIFAPWLGIVIYNAIFNPFKYNIVTTKRHRSIVILTTKLIFPLAILLTLLVGMFATESKTVLKMLRVTGVSAFDIISLRAALLCCWSYPSCYTSKITPPLCDRTTGWV